MREQDRIEWIPVVISLVALVLSVISGYRAYLMHLDALDMFAAKKASVGPGPVAPTPSEADIIAHGMKGDASSSVAWPTETDNQIRGLEYNSTTGIQVVPGGYATRTLAGVDGTTRYEITVPKGNITANRILTLPDTNSEIMTKDSLERDLKLRIVCKEEKTTGKQHNMGPSTAYVPCSRIDQLWMDGVEVWRRKK